MMLSTVQRLPHCSYPKAADIDRHGLQPLPADLPLITLDNVQQYRSPHLKIVPAEKLDSKQFLQLIRVVAGSFAINEPMARHVMPPKQCPADITGTKHKDPFGNDDFGAWTKENILFW